jgi:hypothetical protein
MESIILIISLFSVVISICLIIWIRGLYINSKIIKNLLYVQIRILEKEAEMNGLDISEIYEKGNKISSDNIKKWDKTNY